MKEWVDAILGRVRPCPGCRRSLAYFLAMVFWSAFAPGLGGDLRPVLRLARAQGLRADPEPGRTDRYGEEIRLGADPGRCPEAPPEGGPDPRQDADRLLFNLSPIIVFVGSFLTLVGHALRERNRRGEPRHRYLLHPGGGFPRSGRDHDGRVGLEQQVVPLRGHARRLPDRDIRDPGGPLPHRGHHVHRDAEHGRDRPAHRPVDSGTGTSSAPPSSSSPASSTSSPAWPRSTGPPSTFPRRSRSWSAATTPNTAG